MNLNTTENKKKNAKKASNSESIGVIDQNQIEEIVEEKEDLSALSFDDKLLYWKAKHQRIFKTIIDKEDYIWRRLTRKEYSSIAFSKISDNSKIDIYEKQYLFCKAAVLYPDNICEIMDDIAGIAPTLADEIIMKSGFGEIYPKTEEVESENIRSMEGEEDDN